MKNIFFIILIGLLLLSCKEKDNNPVDPANGDETKISEKTKVVEDQDIDNNLIEVSSDSTTFTFSSDIAEDYDFKEDDIIASKSGYGFLRKVRNVTTTSGQIVVETEQAALTDAVEKTSIKKSFQLSDLGIQKIKYHKKGVKLDTNKLYKTNNPEFDFDINSVLYDNDNNYNTTSDQILVRGNFSMNPTLNISLDISSRELEEYEMTIELDESSKLDFVANYTQNIGHEVTLAELTLQPIVFWIGFLPVAIVPQIDLNVGANCELQAELTSSVEQTVNYTTGLTYQASSGWNSVNEFENSYSHDDPTLSSQASAESYISPDFEFKIYNVLGPYAVGKLFGEIIADPEKVPWWELYIGVSAGVGAKMEIFSHNVFDYSNDEIISYRKLIANAQEGSNLPPSEPSDPEPSDGDSDVSTSKSLSWNCSDPDGDDLSYDIYLGTSENPDIVENNYSSTSYNPGELEENTKYYWKIKAEDGNGGESISPLWEFTTKGGGGGNQPPNVPNNPTPSDNSENISTNTSLSWECSDPDGDALTYDVYFGTSSNPSLASSNQSSTSYSPGSLNENTTYYWQITAKDGNGGETEGNVWSFETESSGGGGGEPCPGVPTVTYAGKTYNTVLIGDQCWLKENLDVGNKINISQNSSENGTIEKYCYDNETSNCDKYGGLYRWDEAMQYSTAGEAQGICPNGWHIPTRDEFEELYSYVNNESDKILAVGETGSATNETGFTVLLGGFSNDVFEFTGLGDATSFWTSSKVNDYFSVNMYINGDNNSIDFPMSSHIVNGYSIRCIKD